MYGAYTYAGAPYAGLLTLSSAVTQSATVQAKARILVNQSQTVQAKARMKVLAQEKTVQAKGRIKLLANDKTVQAKARMKVLANDKTVQAKARIFNTMNQTVQSKARMKVLDQTKTVQAKARIQLAATSQTVQAKARVKNTISPTVSAQARVKVLNQTQTVQAKARVKNTISQGYGVMDALPMGNITGGFGVGTPAVYVGQSFNAKDGILEAAELCMKKTGSPSGDMTAVLYAHTGTYGNGGEPTPYPPGTPLATSDIVNISTISTSYTMVRFTFTGANRYTLVAGTKYVIMVHYTGSGLTMGTETPSNHEGNYSWLDYTEWIGTSSADIPFAIYATMGGISAKARMKVTQSKTVQAKARVKNMVPQTVQAKARMKVLDQTQTVSAKAYIAHVSEQTIQAKARIKNTISPTVQAKARVKKLANDKTVSAKGRVKQVVSRGNVVELHGAHNWGTGSTNFGSNWNPQGNTIFNLYACLADHIIFRLKKTGSPSGTMTAKIYNLTSQSGGGLPTGAPIATSDAVNESSLSTSFTDVTFTFSGANRVALSEGTYYAYVVEVSTVANISAETQSYSDVQTLMLVTSNAGSWGHSALAYLNYAFYGESLGLSAKARVKVIGNDKTVQAKARVFQPGITKTIGAKAKIVFTIDHTIQAKARVKTTPAPTVSAKARMKLLDNTKTVQAKANIVNLVEKTVQAKARVKVNQSKTVSAKAAVHNTVTNTVQAKGRIKIPDNTKTVSAKAKITVPVSQTVQAKARVKQLGTAKTVQAKGRILVLQTKTVQSKARVLVNQSKTVQAKARVKQLGTSQTVSARARLFRTVTNTIQAKARIKQQEIGFILGLNNDTLTPRGTRVKVPLGLNKDTGVLVGTRL